MSNFMQNKIVFLIPVLLFCNKLLPVIGITVDNKLDKKLWVRVSNQLPAEKQSLKNSSIKNIVTDEDIKSIKSGNKKAINSYFIIIPVGKSETIKTESGERLVEWKVGEKDILYRTKKSNNPDKLSIYTKKVQGKDAYHYKIVESVLGLTLSTPKEEFVNWVENKVNGKPEEEKEKKELEKPEIRQKNGSEVNKTEQDLKAKYPEVYKALDIIDESPYAPKKDLIEKYRMYIFFDGTKSSLTMLKGYNVNETNDSARSKKLELLKVMPNISTLNNFISLIEMQVTEEKRKAEYKKFCEKHDAVQKELLNKIKKERLAATIA